ncbi:MAG: tRNA threonylcarbamoyladenosine dehydratase [Lutispora sp.]|nr:tRNA threonylcarbamoyladenosine dehydratase [Lutispora sp.]MDD4833582.1 tRNA threonylcarbamoyladenosine dehydratase [Lutispora sp.]
MLSMYERTELLIGEEGIKKLKDSKIAIFGIGGVGSFAAEALGRCGVGELVLVDYDTINDTNLNRQLHSTTKTIGKYKVDAMKERLLEVNPEIRIHTHKDKYNQDTSDVLLNKDYDYVIDAIDMVTSKINLIVKSIEMNIPIISSMGAGNKLDPSMFEVADIYKTEMCPLAKVLRYELRKHGVKKLKVVYSKERPIKTANVPGSISFVPSAAGLILASVVVKDILKDIIKINY